MREKIGFISFGFILGSPAWMCLVAYLLYSLFWGVPDVEAQSCWNARLCAERGFAYGTYYGPPPVSRPYYYGGRSYYRGGYYGDWRTEAVRGGFGLAGRAMDDATLANMSRDQKEVALAEIHAGATRDARPGHANVSSSWGQMGTEYNDGGFENSQSHEEQRASLPERRHLRKTPRLDVVGLEKLLGEPGILKAEEFVAVSETIDEYLDPSRASHSREVHRENLKHLQTLLTRVGEEWQRNAITSAMEYIREGILS